MDMLDPRGIAPGDVKPGARRPASLRGLRIGVLITPSRTPTCCSDAWRICCPSAWAAPRSSAGPSQARPVRPRITRTIDPTRFRDRSPEDDVAIALTSEDIMVIVAGGPGKHSVIVPTFGATRSVTVCT